MATTITAAAAARMVIVSNNCPKPLIFKLLQMIVSLNSSSISVAIFRPSPRGQFKEPETLAATGLKKPDISILSEEFLSEIPRHALQEPAPWRCCGSYWQEKSKLGIRKNIVQGRSFSLLLENAIRKCQNRAIETAQVIEEIALAKEGAYTNVVVVCHV
jgi:hypothetical protein